MSDKLIVHVLDFSKWKVFFFGAPYHPSENSYAKVLKEWALQTDSHLTWNLGFFNFGTTKNIKEKCAYRSLEYVKGLNGIIFGYNASGLPTEILELPNGNACGGWKLAIKDGTQKCFDTSSKRARNLNGITTNGMYIHAQTTNKVTEKAAIENINNWVQKNYKTSIKLLFVQDAGGSTGCYSTASKILTAGEQEGYNGRAVVTVACARYIGPKVTRILKKGCSGEDVRVLQQILGGIECDGVFGKGTKAQLIIAQKKLGLVADGIAGPVTLRALGLY